MKSIHGMLRELARPEVSEFALVSGRLPCVKVGAKYEPVDATPRSVEAVREMLAEVGGGRHVAELELKPASWTAQVAGLGAVAVHAVLRDGRVQARFTIVRERGAAAPEGTPAPPSPREPPSVRSLPLAPEVRAAPDDDREHAPVRAPLAAAAAIPKAAPSGAAAATPATPTTPRAAPSADGSRRWAALDAILANAREARASDVHVIAGRPPLLRVGGELGPRGAPIDPASAEGMISAIVPERLAADLRERGSCDFALDLPVVGRFRVNVCRQRTGLKACFRLIAREVPTLASLGLPPEIARATQHHQGLVVLSGPTGQGKTSTLAAIVDIINRDTTHHVITVEDPIEYLHPRKRAMISQREVGTHTRSFGNALKGSLREDPDVIVVGELRDTETVRMALAASETGHLVLGTMNTPSAAKTIDRLVDLFPPGDQQQVRMTLAGGLHLVVSQRLIPRADGQGAVAAVELLPASVALWSLIRDAKTYQIPSLQQRGKGFGILRLDESLLELVRSGRATREAALAVAEAPDELEAALAGRRGPGSAAVPVPPSSRKGG